MGNVGRALRVTIGVLALLGLGYLVFGLAIVSWAVTVFVGATWWALLGVILAGLITWSIVADIYAPAAIGLLLGIVSAIALAFATPFGTASAYVQDADATISEPISYQDRAPWVVASAYATRDQGEIVGTKGDVHFVPTGQAGTSRYTAVITGRSVAGNVGYEAIQEMNLPTVGTIPASASNYCEFPDDMGLRLNAGLPWRSLNREMHNVKPGSLWDSNDAYAYCDGTDPVIVVPLTRYTSFGITAREADGAMVYRDAKVAYLTPKELVEQGIQGPTYPRSLAVKQRESLTAMDGYGSYLAGRGGYDTTAKDLDDANADNDTEFTLVSTDGTLRYVTPLTPRGDSESIIALYEVPAQQGYGAGPVINTNVDLPATSTLATAIREASVTGDAEWATRWSAGMKVYEILPAEGDTWAASIGQGQAVSYRATIAADGSVTVRKTDGDAAVPANTPEVTVQSDKPLDEMSDEELFRLIRRALDELESR